MSFSRFAVRALAFTVVLGCSRPPAGSRMLAAPAETSAITTIDDHTVAVLAGEPGARAVFVIDSVSGDVRSSFGVTGQATSLAAASPHGPLLVTVGYDDGARRVGTIEVWSLDGVKKRVVGLPGAALQITTPSPDSYVLVETGDHSRAAVSVDPDGRFAKPIPLPADVNAIAACAFSDHRYLAMSRGDRRLLSLEDLTTGRTQETQIAGSQPECVAQTHALYALQEGVMSKSIVVLSVPSMLQEGVVPAPLDGIALTKAADPGLYVVDTAGKASTFEHLSAAMLDPSLAGQRGESDNS